jgi:hypothetical protein
VCFLQTCTVPFRTANREMLAAGNMCPFQDSRAGLPGRNHCCRLFFDTGAFYKEVRPPAGSTATGSQISKVDHRVLCASGASQETLLGEAEHGVAGDDQVIEDTHVDQREAFP